MELTLEEITRFGPVLKEIIDGTLPTALPTAFVTLCEETAIERDCSFAEAATAIATRYPNVYEAYRRNALQTHRWEY